MKFHDDSPVDGGGMALPEHAANLAEKLALTPEQSQLLLAELRNALVPAWMVIGSEFKRISGPDREVRAIGLGIERVLSVCDAISKRGGVR